MLPEARALLSDILRHGREIQSETAGMDQKGYSENTLVQKAVQWDFAVIGEAMTRLRSLDMATADRITDWRRIIAFRNQLIHGYDIIRDNITWNVVSVHLPVLMSEIESLLKEDETGG